MGLSLGVSLITLSGLLFEIALTRIFSATIWYHFAFVAISVALLGWVWAVSCCMPCGACSRDSEAGPGSSPCSTRSPSPRPLAHRPASLPPGPARLLLPGLAAPLSAGRHRALPGLRPAPRAGGRPLFRRPPGRGAGRLGRDPAVVVARGRGGRAPGALAPLLAAALFSRRLAGPSALLLVLLALAPTSARASSRSRARPPRACTSTWPTIRARGWPHRLELLFPNRRGHGLREPLPRPPLHRLGCLDQRADVGRRTWRARPGARMVPGAALPARARAPGLWSSAPAVAPTCSWPWARAARR